MKKLNSIFLLLSFFFVNSVFAQTKEETISWLKEKIIKHNECTVEILNISPCEIYYKIICNEVGFVTYKLNPNATLWEVNNGRVNAKSGSVIEEITFYKDGNTRYEYDNGFYVKEKGVPDIAERFAKALNHLATFCEKKKETF